VEANLPGQWADLSAGRGRFHGWSSSSETWTNGTTIVEDLTERSITVQAKRYQHLGQLPRDREHGLCSTVHIPPNRQKDNGIVFTRDLIRNVLVHPVAGDSNVGTITRS